MTKIPNRSDVKTEYTWRLEDMFASDTLWQEEYDRLKKDINLISGFSGRLAEGAAALLDCLTAADSLERRVRLVYTYASLRLSEDNTNSFYSGLNDKAAALYTKFSALLSFFEPELLALGKAKIAEYMADKSELGQYAHYFDDLFRNREHTLSDKEEAILAAGSKAMSAASDIYQTLYAADLKFNSVKDKNGVEHQLSQSNYTTLLQSPDRVLRENAFTEYYRVYKDFRFTMAAIYSSSVTADTFYSEARNFSSSLEMSLFGDNVPRAVYKNLIDSIHKFLPDMHRYVSLRKKRLGVSELHMYDIYTTIVSDLSVEISFEEATGVLLKALSVLGEDYTAAVAEGINERWIDIYENTGKDSGAFSGGCYDSNPYILLNYNGTIDDLFTFAHEMGHSMHSYYSRKSQPPVYGDYTTFLAEVASTVNEVLLMEYLLKTTEDTKLKEYFLNYYLDQFKGTMFRQTMFSEFEMLTHEAAENDVPLTVDFLKDQYYRLNKLYFGGDMVSDEDIAYEWSRIPHFYSAFYVYKYATGFAAAVAIAKKILNGEPGAAAAYRNFLSSGNSDYPIETLKKAGLDMTDPKTIDDALTVFSDIVTQLEKI